MASFEELLPKATAIHGHPCAGQVIGVRLAMPGLAARSQPPVQNCRYPICGFGRRADRQ